jgi:hypothetical protein
MIPFELSKNLTHTWFFDLDGTIFKHDGIFNDGYDTLLPGVVELWDAIPGDDVIVITTAREDTVREATELFLEAHGLRYDHILFGLAHGERIVVNDDKPEGLLTAIAWNVKRNQGY